MREQILKAQRSKAKYIVIVGLMEARSGIFQVRNNED
jgi:histidyl-tRNA synthetase